MKKKLIISLLIAMLITTTAGIAYAAWYFRDPVVEIAGTTVTIDVGKNLSPDITLEEPDKAIVVVPRGIEAKVVDAQGDQVRIVHRGKVKKEAKRVPFSVVVITPKAPRGKHYRVAVVVSNGNQSWKSKGWSGKPVKVKGWVPGNHEGHGDHDSD